MKRLAMALVLVGMLPSIGSAQNPYYDHGLFPSPGTLGSSSAMRAELDLIEAGFSKLPSLVGNGNNMVSVNPSGTALTSKPITGTEFPSGPSVGDVFLVRDDSAVGACDSAAGAAWSVCAWNGTTWIAVGSGGVTIAGGITPPATCTPAANATALFYDTDNNQYFLCTATNTYTQINPAEAQGLAQVTAINNSSTGNDESNPFEILGTGGQSANGVQLFQSSAGEMTIRCINATGANKCNYYRTIDDGYFGGFKDYLGNIKFEVSGNSGAVTRATIDCSSANVLCTVTKTREFEFVACQDTVAYHIWNTGASTKPAAACDTVNTNTIKGYASFNDTTDQLIYAGMMLPSGYVAGSLGVEFIWKAAATTGAVGLCMQAVRVADGTLSDQALPVQAAGNCVSDTAKGTTLQENHASIAAVTCTSCAALDDIKIGFSRDADGGAVTDSMTGDAHVMKAIVSWKELQ